MPPVVSEATPVAAGATDSGDQLQALFEGLNFAELEGQFASNPELLGALGAEGNRMLRDFLGRLKKADAEDKVFESYLKNKGSDAEAGDAGTLFHPGPVQEPFVRGGDPYSVFGGASHEQVRGRTMEETSQRVRDGTRKLMALAVESSRLHAESTFVVKAATGLAKALGELTKGQ
jgi:hypothetical protein